MSQQCVLAAFLGYIRQSAASSLGEVILSLCSAQVRSLPRVQCPGLGSSVCDTHVVQKRASKLIKGLQHLMCEERLREQGPFSLGRRSNKEILLICTNISEEGAKRTEPNSSVVSSDRARDNGHNLQHRSVPLKIFPVRVTKHWCRLLREVVESPSLEIFKTSQCNWRWVAVLARERLHQMDFRGPFPSQIFYDSLISLIPEEKESGKDAEG